MASLWLAAWAIVLVVGFATKTTTEFSRATAIGFFLAGLPALYLSRLVVVGLIRQTTSPSSPSINRIHLVGFEDDIASFHANNDAEALNLRVVGTSYLRRVDPREDASVRQSQMAEDLDLAVSVVRFLAARRRLHSGSLDGCGGYRALHRGVPARAGRPPPTSRLGDGPFP